MANGLLRADWKVGLAALATGVVFDWVAHVGGETVVGVIAVLVVDIALLFSGRFVSKTSKTALVLVPMFAVWFAVRSSDTLQTPNVLVVISLFALAGLWSRNSSFILHAPLSELIDRAISLVSRFFGAPLFLARAIPLPHDARVAKAMPVIRGLIIAFPIALILGLLLASADSVFGSLFSFHLDLGELPVHVFLIGFGGWLAGTVLNAASQSHQATSSQSSRKLGFIEASVILGVVVVLYLVFVITQIVVWAGGAQHVLHTSGLTYADHARQGFFQLIAVSVITLLLLTAFRSSVVHTTSRQKEIWLALSYFTIALTLVIVGVAVQRLHMYESAYGLTVLRLYSTLFSFWIGFIFVLFAAGLARADSQSKWFLAASVISGVAVVWGMNFVNPERYVVNRNLDRLATSSIPFDVSYAALLGDDGVGAVADRFGELNADQQKSFTDTVCTSRVSHDSSGWSYNASSHKVDEFVSKVCSPTE